MDPYTTSSHTIAGGSIIGTGIGPQNIDDIIGIVKAYTTRVGEGPLPTELFDKNGKHLQDKGHEYGTTTSRPRRCGWLDLVMVRYSVRVNGISTIALTKVDVLSGLKDIKICVAYNHDGEEIRDFPANMHLLSKCQPIYVKLKGWGEYSRSQWLDFANRGYNFLPRNLKRYIGYIEEELKASISHISFGPERRLTLKRRTTQS